MKKIMIIISVFFITMITVKAQQVREQDIAYKKHIVRSVDLRDPVNKELFARKEHISKVLINAVLSGKYAAYYPDQLDRKMDSLELYNRMSYTIEDSEKRECYLFQQFYVLEIGEDLVFDKNRSEFIYIPLYITVIIPAEMNYKGIMEPIATWKYEDYVKIFKNDPAAYIEKYRINFNEAFLLRGYHSEIVKIGYDYTDMYFDQMYHDPLKRFLALQAEENKIMEKMYSCFNPQ